jgi:hypothetical protein
MNNKAWSKDGNKFYPISTATFESKLDTGVYVIKTPPMAPMYFQQIKEDFTFPYKIYGHNSNLIDRVSKAYNNTTGNLGMLLNGMKGTGKSVTAEMICNKMAAENSMPVILITEEFEGLSEILAGIQQDVTIFIDEFEKVFSRDIDDYSVDTSKNILTIMDGALKTEYRRLFVFTTNKMHINDNLLQRPGRLRYVVEFNDLQRDVIEEIVDDMLKYPEHRDATIEFIGGLKMITVDIVKAVISEVNIFNEKPDAFKSVFNVEEKGTAFNVYVGDVTTSNDYVKPKYVSVQIEPNPEAYKNSPSRYTDRNLYVDGAYLGETTKLEGRVITYKTDSNKKESITFETAKSYHSMYADLAF